MTTPTPDSAGELRAHAKLVEAILALPWITVEQAAVVVGCHPSTIRRAAREGTLRAVRVNGGRRWRTQPADVDDWLRRGQHESSDGQVA